MRVPSRLFDRMKATKRKRWTSRTLPEPIPNPKGKSYGFDDGQATYFTELAGILLIKATLATLSLWPHSRTPISAGKPPELHPKMKTQAYINFY